jgi:hypothetical protein
MKIMLKRALLLVCVAALTLTAGEQTRLQIVLKNAEDKPVGNASVVVKFVQGRSKIKLTKIRKAWELRSNQEGSVKIPAIPQGKILIQVIAKGYQTFGETFDVDEEEKTIEIKLNPPQKQYSVH